MIIPTDNMVITQDATCSPNVNTLPSGIKLLGNNLTLDRNGAVLLGENYNRKMIYRSGNNITLKNI